METTDWISVLSALAIQVPILLACIAALAVILTKPALAPEVTKWAVAGFALALALCFAGPAIQALVMSSIRSGNTSRVALISAGASLLSALLHAVAYLLLLAAILAGHAASESTKQPPARKPERSVP